MVYREAGETRIYYSLKDRVIYIYIYIYAFANGTLLFIRREGNEHVLLFRERAMELSYTLFIERQGKRTYVSL